MKAERLVINAKGDERTIRYIPENYPPNTIVLPDKKEVRIDWRRNFDRLKAISEIIKSGEITQEEGDYNARIDNPNCPYIMGVVFSDAHIGAYTSDHQLIQDLLEITLQEPNTFLLDDGDTFNNGIWGGLQFEDTFPPYMQAFTIKDIGRELGEKYGAMVIGNHPEWMFRAAGVHPEYLFYEQVKGPIFAGMGLLHLQAGGQKYDIAMAHTYWGKSKLNIHNVCRNLRQQEYPDADVFIVGHEHIWGHMKEMVSGREVLNLRPGTGKTEDRYARIHGIAKRGQKMGLGILFRTDKKWFNAMPIADCLDLLHLYK